MFVFGYRIQLGCNEVTHDVSQPITTGLIVFHSEFLQPEVEAADVERGRRRSGRLGQRQQVAAAAALLLLLEPLCSLSWLLNVSASLFSLCCLFLTM